MGTVGLGGCGGGWVGFNVIFQGGEYIGGLRSLENRCLSGLQERLGSHEGKPLQTRNTSSMEAVTRSRMGATKPMASQE